jgi:hypothetical protein
MGVTDQIKWLREKIKITWPEVVAIPDSSIDVCLANLSDAGPEKQLPLAVLDRSSFKWEPGSLQGRGWYGKIRVYYLTQAYGEDYPIDLVTAKLEQLAEVIAPEHSFKLDELNTERTNSSMIKSGVWSGFLEVGVRV